MAAAAAAATRRSPARLRRGGRVPGREQQQQQQENSGAILASLLQVRTVDQFPGRKYVDFSPPFLQLFTKDCHVVLLSPEVCGRVNTTGGFSRLESCVTIHVRWDRNLTSEDRSSNRLSNRFHPSFVVMPCCPGGALPGAAVMLRLPCRKGFFSSGSEQRLLFTAVHRLRVAEASVVADHRLWAHGLQ
ncbi:hypothetical protein MJG53_010711 [Ovis ammon polii x Ovis aries]|uniref:Uncharacterized protein n=1 Tax=Ovis ammon polii x Ovis aries TaxID=2918886 RepID=A0ACB9UUY0_9CETA|nr:hypothetical protein MJG53_010711 [Ovis ammon polii x Ovis aries]